MIIIIIIIIESVKLIRADSVECPARKADCSSYSKPSFHKAIHKGGSNMLFTDFRQYGEYGDQRSYIL